ncbi:MAG: hypothetical protein IJX76_02870, partial [Clostridia bacterium]|nr:hypothetical protein [Clostridia bacterium]
LPKGAIIGIIAGGVGAVLIALIILLISLLSGNSEEDVIDLYFQASCYADADAAMDLLPDEMMGMAMEFYGDEDDYRDSIEDELKDSLDRAEDEYGDFESYEFEIVDEDEYDLDDLDYYLGLLDIDIESAKEVEIDYTIYFEDDEVEDSITLILIEVDGSWYIMDGEDLF